MAYYRSGWVFYPASGSPGASAEGKLFAWVKDEDVLYVFDGANWVNAVASGIALEDLADTSFTDLAEGDILRWNGYEWANEAPSYDIGINRTSGTLSSEQVLVDFVFPRSCVLPAHMLSSVAEATVAAAAQADIDVRKSGSSVGTIRFAAGGTSASFIAANDVTFDQGDNLLVVGPASADATLAGVVVTLAFKRS